MITVKFFGLLRVNNNIKQLRVKEGTVRQVLDEVMRLHPSITEQQLKQAIMVINKKQITGNKRFSIKLKEGDELVFLSPASGG